MKLIAPATKMDNDDSLTQYGGLVGNDGDYGVDQSVVVNDKGLKRGPSQYVNISLVHVSNKLIDEFSHPP